MKNVAEGDFIWLPDPGSQGAEQAGRRPAMVVSVNDFNDIGMAVVCAVTSHQGTSHATRNPLEVAIPKGLTIAGAVLCDQVRTVDWKARGATTIANAGRTTLLEVRARLRKLIGV